mmetsp:Transcript_13282/g.42899  ORF Transcript_13282/g.42899 Transcript_13282/m.42899 type:complete len:255 (+) Transcript_13282:245-1009(+)
MNDDAVDDDKYGEKPEKEHSVVELEQDDDGPHAAEQHPRVEVLDAARLLERALTSDKPGGLGDGLGREAECKGEEVEPVAVEVLDDGEDDVELGDVVQRGVVGEHDNGGRHENEVRRDNDGVDLDNYGVEDGAAVGVRPALPARGERAKYDAGLVEDSVDGTVSVGLLFHAVREGEDQLVGGGAREIANHEEGEHGVGGDGCHPLRDRHRRYQIIFPLGDAIRAVLNEHLAHERIEEDELESDCEDRPDGRQLL